VVLSKSPEFYNGRLSVWDVEAQKQLSSMETPYWISSLSMSQKGDVLAVVLGGRKEDVGWITDGKPREIRIYSFPEMKELGKLAVDRYVNFASLSPNGKLLAAASISDRPRAPAEVTILDVATLKARFTVAGFAHVFTQVRFSPDGRVFAVTDYVDDKDGGKNTPGARIRIFDSENGGLQKEIELAENRRSAPVDFFFASDGKKIIVDCKSFSEVDIGTGQEIKIEGIAKSGGTIATTRSAITTDGKWILSGANFNIQKPDSHPPVITVIDVLERKTVAQWVPKDVRNIRAFAVSPDKKTIAIGSDHVYLFDLGGK
jgi:dipeptidyl aminopeptidase/acylaminoacyl peptidase